MRKVMVLLLLALALLAFPGIAGAQNGTILPERAYRVSPNAFQNGTILPY